MFYVFLVGFKTHCVLVDSIYSLALVYFAAIPLCSDQKLPNIEVKAILKYIVANH